MVRRREGKGGTKGTVGHGSKCIYLRICCWLGLTGTPRLVSHSCSACLCSVNRSTAWYLGNLFQTKSYSDLHY